MNFSSPPPFLWSLYLVYSPKVKLSVTFVTVTVLISVHFSIFSMQYCDKNCYSTDSFITRCQRGNCQPMWREGENICCQEVDAIKNKNLEAVTVEELETERSIQDLRQCASMYGFCRQLGYSTSNSTDILRMRSQSTRKTATLPTGN